MTGLEILRYMKYLLFLVWLNLRGTRHLQVSVQEQGIQLILNNGWRKLFTNINSIPMYLALHFFCAGSNHSKLGKKSSKQITTVVELWLKWWLLFLSMQFMTIRMSEDSSNHDEEHILDWAKPSQVSQFTSQFSLTLFPPHVQTLSIFLSLPTAAYHMQYSTPLISCW